MTFSRLARLCLVVLALGSAAAVGACNTVQGAGKDIERGGEKIQDAAKDLKAKL